jgi:hypothetical protein
LMPCAVPHGPALSRWIVDYSAFAVYVLIGLVVLRGILIGIGAALILRPVTDCPACFAPTLLLQRKWFRRLLPWMEWRWCPHCGWNGPAKRVPTRAPSQWEPRDRPAPHSWEEPGGPRF